MSSNLHNHPGPSSHNRLYMSDSNPITEPTDNTTQNTSHQATDTTMSSNANLHDVRPDEAEQERLTRRMMRVQQFIRENGPPLPAQSNEDGKTPAERVRELNEAIFAQERELVAQKRRSGGKGKSTVSREEDDPMTRGTILSSYPPPFQAAREEDQDPMTRGTILSSRPPPHTRRRHRPTISQAENTTQATVVNPRPLVRTQRYRHVPLTESSSRAIPAASDIPTAANTTSTATQTSPGPEQASTPRRANSITNFIRRHTSRRHRTRPSNQPSQPQRPQPRGIRRRTLDLFSAVTNRRRSTTATPSNHPSRPTEARANGTSATPSQGPSGGRSWSREKVEDKDKDSLKQGSDDLEEGEQGDETLSEMESRERGSRELKERRDQRDRDWWEAETAREEKERKHWRRLNRVVP